MVTIKLHNTKSRSKETFTPIDPNNVRMYVCGPTVYDRAHLGNARPVVVFDVLYRLLRLVYGPDHVTYVRNFTDVDDKINAEALRRQKAGDPRTLEALIAERTEETIGWYHADMDALGALRPNHEPRATEYIPQMVTMIDELLEKGFAYRVAATIGHNSRAQYVYLDSTRAPAHAFLSVESFAKGDFGYQYGELSGRSVDDMIAGSRSETGEGKRNPMDSVLWKPSTIEQPGWESPWGFGRPGWHIECSAMSRELLGKKFDIHGGGLDLLFPHHENEVAQCRACDGPDASAQYWMHNEMLQVEGKKMSKSLGNFFTVRDLLDQGIPGEVIRFVLLSTHYGKPMDWTKEKAEQAEATLRKWRTITDGVEEGNLDEEFLERLSDDLNTAGAIGSLHRLYAYAFDYKDETRASLKASAKLLGLLGPETGGWIVATRTDQGNIKMKIEGLMSERYTLRQMKLFEAADEIRSRLIAAGVSVNEGKDSYTYDLTPNFDPAKLDALK